MPGSSAVPSKTSFELLLQEALDLSDHERAQLAARLLESLQEQRSVLGHQQWVAEMEERARVALAGQPGRSWAQTRLEILKRMRW